LDFPKISVKFARFCEEIRASIDQREISSEVVQAGPDCTIQRDEPLPLRAPGPRSKPLKALAQRRHPGTFVVFVPGSNAGHQRRCDKENG
jgi:hypothetical protein